MTLREEINTIIGSPNISYEEKAEKLSKLITTQELNALLPKSEYMPKLKEPLKPKTTGMRVLNLSLMGVYFDAILRGTKTIEFRDYTDYYKKRCTYTDGGKTYLVPFDAITFYQGRLRSMTVALTNITCDGNYFMFHLGEILYPKP